MFKRVKLLLVESYIGSIALGILLADAVLEFSDIFVTPLANWVARRNFQSVLPNSSTARMSPLRSALPHFESFVVLILVWYLLLLWLYSKPQDNAAPAGQAPKTSQLA